MITIKLSYTGEPAASLEPILKKIFHKEIIGQVMDMVTPVESEIMNEGAYLEFMVSNDIEEMTLEVTGASDELNKRIEQKLHAWEAAKE